MSLLRMAVQALGPKIDRVLRLASSHMPGVLITRHGNVPYLWRFYFESKEAKQREIDSWPPGEPEQVKESKFGVFLHEFVDSDEITEVHNHPWEWCLSIILTSGYFENRCEWVFDESKTGVDGAKYAKLTNHHVRLHLPFTINFIRHRDMHRVTLLNGSAWTLFFHGPRVSTWGFADLQTFRYREITRRTANFIKQGVV